MFDRRSRFVLLLLLSIFQVSLASPGIVPVARKVENLEHYKLLALQHGIVDELYSGWKIEAVIVSDYALGDVVASTVRLQVPIDSSSFQNQYSFRFVMRFVSDSLINESEVRAGAIHFVQALAHLEKHPAIQVFRQSTKVRSAQIHWHSDRYELELKSTTGDSLLYLTLWPTGPDREWILMLNFSEPKLLDQLELFLSRFPIPHVTEFRSNVGLGYARLYKNRLLVSSGGDCSGSNACFTAYHSLGLITSYRLPSDHAWSGFPYYSRAMKAVEKHLSMNPALGCLISRNPTIAFTIMSYQQNTLTRSIYVPVRCDNNSTQFLSVSVNTRESDSTQIKIHNSSVLDSLQVECVWDWQTYLR